MQHSLAGRGTHVVDSVLTTESGVRSLHIMHARSPRLDTIPSPSTIQAPKKMTATMHKQHHMHAYTYSTRSKLPRHAHAIHTVHWHDPNDGACLVHGPLPRFPLIDIRPHAPAVRLGASERLRLRRSPMRSACIIIPASLHARATVGLLHVRRT